MQATADTAQRSVNVIKGWATRFLWGKRVAEYEAYLAGLETEATKGFVQVTALDWLKRQHQVRQREWELHEKCIEASRRALDNVLRHKRVCATLTEIARLLELASKLGRLASGLPTDHTELTGEEGGPLQIELTAALNKIYGSAAVVDVEATAAPVAAFPNVPGSAGSGGDLARPGVAEARALPTPPSGDQNAPERQKPPL